MRAGQLVIARHYEPPPPEEMAELRCRLREIIHRHTLLTRECTESTIAATQRKEDPNR